MDEILRRLGLEDHVVSFQEQNISPDIVGLLSSQEMHCLGINNKADMVKLRNECITYGFHTPERKHIGSGTTEFVIPESILQNLSNDGFSIAEIARLLSISESTVYRRMRKFGISKQNFSEMDDDELDVHVSKASENFPHCGENILGQILKQKSVNVQRWRLRESLHRVNAVGVRDRRKGRLKRRVYDVKGPNHLWHVDTNHKLIRWHLVIAGGIDGFSRMVIYLRCLDNNKADTLLECFRDGVSRFGLPVRVRSDKGLENSAIADYMIPNRGLGKGSMLTGKSVHNQRIERLWRDVYTGVLAFFYKLFYHMEDNDILDPLDDLHIAALHYVFVPQINEKLKIWEKAWATHRMRTTKSSPHCLWVAGQIQNPTGIDFVDVNYGTEGFLLEADNNDENVNERPIIPSISSAIITAGCKQQLDNEVQISENSSNFLIEMYTKSLQIIKNHQEINHIQ